MSFARLLVCDDEAGLRETLAILFRRADFYVDVVPGTKQALIAIDEAEPYDVIITDLSMPDGSGMEVLEHARAKNDSTQIVMITAYATTEQAVAAMRLGAYDYIQKPFKNEELRATIDKALEKRWIVAENKALRAKVQQSFQTGDIVGKSEAIQRIRSLVLRIAPSKSSVFITGESGTGKEIIARALHQQSDRDKDPFIVVNCGALPETLMESELFGHEKGAFTGATTRKEGLVRAAHKGTLFLDEIGELPLVLQVKLLRVLQERKVRPVGSEHEHEVDIRVVAATNREIEQEVSEGRFRQDLFYRLNVLRVHLPPLRKRPEDIPLLAEHFLRKHSLEQGKRLVFSPEALRWIASQPYYGNVRELENIVERAVTLAYGSEVTREDLPEPRAPSLPPPSIDDLPDVGFDLDAYLGDFERRILLKAIHESAGNRTMAAKKLGMTLRSFRYRLQKYGIDEGVETPQDE